MTDGDARAVAEQIAADIDLSCSDHEVGRRRVWVARGYLIETLSRELERCGAVPDDVIADLITAAETRAILSTLSWSRTSRRRVVER